MISADQQSVRGDTRIADMLMDFTDTLFYNFKTFEATQKAFPAIAEELGICRAVVCISSKTSAEPLRVLYETDAVIGEDPRIEEKSIHSFDGSTYVYRLYRKPDAAPLTMLQRRIMEFVFKLLHTYVNRQTSLEMSRYAKTHDMMLECLNANGLSEQLTKYRQEGMDFTGYAAVFMNVCKFKTINKRVGFENGNRVLHYIVNTFRNMLTGQESFSHIGGDNFTLFLRRENLQERLDAVNSMICPIHHEGRTIPIEITFRMGVFCVESRMTEVTEMLENASIAYGFARQSGKEDIVYFNEKIRRQYDFRKMVESAFRPALHDGEFRIYLQPKVDLNSYRIIGAEALSRWMHDGTLIKPDDYIPILEHSGQIVHIDFYVFERVCELLRRWMDAGEPAVKISVNFSKITLGSAGFVEKLYRIATRYNVPVEYLEVEFTETCCMEDDGKFSEILCALRSAGFSASLDDFGKGYSSINMLRNMNFDVLKLDKSFHTVGSEEEESGRIILRSIIKMAQQLGIQVISEGVENAEQAKFLKQLKCEQAQGYYFDKPLLPDVFMERLKEGVYVREE